MPAVSVIYSAQRPPGENRVLAAEGTVSATVRVNPLVLTVSAPQQVLIHQAFKVEARLRNQGETKITNLVVTIYVPPGLTVVTRAERNIGTLPSQKEKTSGG